MTVVLRNNNKEPLVIPRAARRKAGFKSGQDLEIKASGGVITVLPKPPAADDEYTPEQRRIIDREIRKGLEDVKRGRLRGPFLTHEDFVASLHAETRKLSSKGKKRSAR